MDLSTQYELAILADFYGPSARVQRLAGLTDADVDARFEALTEDAGIAERLRPAHRRARALLELVADRQVPAEAVAALQQCLREMEAWSRR